ncbi:MAG: hypothetical protein J6S49_05895 [Erysipelotrichaceae bacterium]|nr:hypothetical protein [Erysipelotrichaceae bacterium]
MLNKDEITIEELEKIVGGTVDESAQLILPLAIRGYGAFIKSNYDQGRNDLVDIEGMQEFFASKGYKFIPGFGETQNIFVGPDGLKYGNDYIIYLLETEQL